MAATVGAEMGGDVPPQAAGPAGWFSLVGPADWAEIDERYR